MSKSSGTADEILNLPSGGGSVSGSGTTFNVDLNTGTLSAGLDLRLPTGPNGIAPQIQLQYSSSSPDGPFGLGWSLGVLTILRKLALSAEPPDPTATGTYTMSGVGDLVDMGNGVFRPTVDATGQLIEFANGSWTVTDNTDSSFTLGTTTNAQIGSNPPAAWLLDSCSDSSGNIVKYAWINSGEFPAPDTISWGTYQLVFKYEPRPDLLISGSFGAPLSTSQRCKAIELHVISESASLVRSWQLLYNDDNGLGRSLLATVRERGYGADGTSLAAPDRTFAYTQLGTAAFVPVTGFTAPLNSPDTDLVDLNGDGLPDSLSMGGGLPTMSQNLGGGNFGFPRAISQAPSPLRLSSSNVAFADMSGAGNADLLVLDEPFSGYYPLSAPGGSAPTGFGLPVVFERAPSPLPGDPRVRMLDLNGDGVTDILFDTGRAWLVYLREGESAWADEPLVLPSDRTPPVSLTDFHVYLGDMTGDGLTDIVLVNGSGVTYWPACADGGWGAAVSMSPNVAAGRDWEAARLSLIDIDGDGCADLVYVGPASVTLWRNVGANRLSAPTVFTGTPSVSLDGYRVVDLLGSRTAGIHYELPPTRGSSSRQTFFDLTGGVKPYLLSDIGNGPGQTTHITYRSSTEFAQDDVNLGSPWQTYHPFPVQCVAQTDQKDLGAGVTATTQYRYHDGRYDPVARLFLGFGKVDADQIGDKTSPTLRTKTVFHLGLDPSDPTRPLLPSEALSLGALRRKVLSTTVYGLDGSELEPLPYSVVNNTYQTVLVPSGLLNGQQVAVPYLSTSTEQRWERQATMVSSRVLQFLEISPEGDVTKQRTTATRAGVATPDQDVITTMTFTIGGKNIRLPVRVTQAAADGTVLGATVTYYDGDAYVGLPEGRATLGLQTRIEDLAFDDAFVASIWGNSPPDLTQYGYHRQDGDSTGWWMTRRSHERSTNAAGPMLLSKGPLGDVQTVQLESTCQRTVSVVDPMGNKMTSTTNPRVFQTESITDANNLTTSDVFDALGRVVATVSPLDTAALPTATFSFAIGAVSTITANSRIAHGQPEMLQAITYLDGAGNTMGQAMPNSVAGNWIIAGATAKNMRGMVTQSFQPYEVNGSGWQAPPTGTGATGVSYDALGRVIQQTRPDGLAATTRREGAMLIVSEQWPGGTATDVEQQTFDAAGQLISVSRNAGDHWVEQTYQYAPSGRAVSIGLPDGSQVTFGYDLLGRRFSHESPDTGKTVYVLDAAGNERLRTLATGQQVRTEIDAAGRVTQIFHDAETTPRIAYKYLDTGEATPTDGITANRYARLWRITDELGTLTLQYDPSGHIVNSTRTVSATGAVFSETYAYDALGRTTSTTLPSTTGSGAGRTVDYTFGADGQLSTASGLVTSVSYDVFGRPTALDLANGTQTLLDYRSGGGAISRVRVIDSSGAVLRDESTTVSEALVTGISSATALDDAVGFGYDGLKRLTWANYTGADTHAWAYDDSFLMTSSTDAGVVTYKTGTHQLASVAGTAVTFDAAGRMTSGRFGQMVFDSSDHLAQVTTLSGQSVAHTYAYSGVRARTTVGGVQTYLAPTDNFVIEGSHSIAWLSFGPLKLVAEVSGELWFLHPNALGKMDLVTDSAGHEASRMLLSPYGANRPSTGTAPTGGAEAVCAVLVSVDITGLVCLGQRWYDPSLGQFVSPDPFVTGIYTVGVWNPYLYCLGNPISLSDPNGLSFASIMEVVGIAALCAAIVVLTIVSGGAFLAGMGVLSSGLSTGMIVSVSIGAFGGAISGELSAQKSGGNVWDGALVGAYLGGATALAGGVLGSWVGSALKSTPWLMYAASGAVQGLIAGTGSGLAVGYAGGAGTASQMWHSVEKGAMWGAAFGALLGLGAWSLVGRVPAGQTPYFQLGNMVNKYDALAQNGTFDTLSTIDNDYGAIWDADQIALKGFTAASGVGLLPDFMGVQNVTGSLPLFGGGSLLNISLAWVPSIALNGGAFAAAVDVSFASDEAGFSYADQVALLLKAAPLFVDFALTIFQVGNFDDTYNEAANALNRAFGSANPNEYA
jgi:RHS repeat-associated protein